MGKMVKVNGKMVFNPYGKVTKSDIFFQPRDFNPPSQKPTPQKKQVVSDYEEALKRKVKPTNLVWKSDEFATNPVEDGSWDVGKLLRDLHGMRFFHLVCYIGYGVHASCVKSPWVFTHTMEVLKEVEEVGLTDGTIRDFLIDPKETSDQYEQTMNRVVTVIMDKLTSYDGKTEAKRSCFAIATRIKAYKETIRVSQKISKGGYVHLMDRDKLDDPSPTKKGTLLEYFHTK